MPALHSLAGNDLSMIKFVSSAVLLGVLKHNLQSTVQSNEGDMITRHLNLWKESYAAVDMLVWVVAQIQCSLDKVFN